MNVNEANAKTEPEKLFDVNALTNAIDDLESAAQFLERDDDFRWKWTALAAHHALYAFSITSLARGNTDLVISHGRDDEGTAFKQDGARTYRSRRIYIDDQRAAYRIGWIETSEQPNVRNDPEDNFVHMTGRLISYWTALARIQDDSFMTGHIDLRPIAITDEDLKAIQWLGLDVRNRLIHFVPSFWGFSIEGIQRGYLAALKTIESLVFESNAIYPLEDADRDRIRQGIRRLRAALSAQET